MKTASILPELRRLSRMDSTAFQPSFFHSFFPYTILVSRGLYNGGFAIFRLLITNDRPMWKELLTSSAAQWIFGIAGTATLMAIAYYVIGRIKEDASEEIPTPEENLVEFDRMRHEGHLQPGEFQEVKKNLAHQIVKKRIEDRE